MTLIVNRGIPIPTEFLVPDTFQQLLPIPQIDIGRVAQTEDAWCYAACAEMIINHSRQDINVTQCEIASFVKQDNCCESLPKVCTDRGCTKEEISLIFEHWEVDSLPLKAHLNLVDVETEIDAERLIQVVVDWRGLESSHAVLISGFSGDWLNIIDPLQAAPYDGWSLHADVMDGFGGGDWTDTWIELIRQGSD